MFFQDRAKEPPTFVLHVKASILFAMAGGGVLGLLETVVVLDHLNGPVSFRPVGMSALVTPPLLGRGWSSMPRGGPPGQPFCSCCVGARRSSRGS